MSATDHESPFDYIVVGGGTAGLVLASRLSEDAAIRVLVVEAGADRGADPLVLTPGLIIGMYGNEDYDWIYVSTPQPMLNDRQLTQVRGKCLGGSSALNFMMALYPSRADLDAWGRLGNKGWDFDGLTPYFGKFATVHTPSASARAACGLAYHDESLKGNGPVDISFSENYDNRNSAWIGAFEELGFKMTADPRSGKATGGFQNGVTINPETKTRSYSQSAYLTADVLKRENLAVVTETLVTKVLFEKGEDGQAVATDIAAREPDGTERTYKASREVILSAGALQSPQVLELSGIGDKNVLESLGIPVTVENPNVGEHLQDHCHVSQAFEVKPEVLSDDRLARDPSLLDAATKAYKDGAQGQLGESSISAAYVPLTDGTGPVSRETKEAFLRDALATVGADQNLPSTEKETEILREQLLAEDEPAIQYMLFPFQINVPAKSTNIEDQKGPKQPGNYLSMLTMLNHPFSRGSCHITSADARVKPTWDPKYNANAADLEVLARGVQFAERVRATAPFSGLFKDGGRRVPDVVGDSLEAARRIVRERQMTVFHLSGSCAMLPRELGGVVDERLCVYGTKGLRVADASVFPLVPAGNIQTTVYAVAEKAADLIKEDRR